MGQISFMMKLTYTGWPYIWSHLISANINACWTFCADGAVLCTNNIQGIQQIYCVTDSDLPSTNSKSTTFNTYYFINLHAKLAQNIVWIATTDYIYFTSMYFVYNKYPEFWRWESDLLSHNAIPCFSIFRNVIFQNRQATKYMFFSLHF